MDILEGISEIQQRQIQPMPPAAFVMAGDARHPVLTSSAVLANDLYLGDRLRKVSWRGRWFCAAEGFLAMTVVFLFGVALFCSWFFCRLGVSASPWGGASLL